MRRVILLILACIWAVSVSPAYAYWIWTPKTGKWVNPKTMVKPTPKEQYDYAIEFYNLKKYDDAIREFKKLLKAYPKSYEASESQYYMGRSEEEKNNLYEAFLAYQKVVDKYPFSERIKEIIEREYKIGEIFMSGEKRKALGVPLPVENPSIEIFTKVVENSTYGPIAPKAQYKLGLVLKGLVRFDEAEEAFNKVVTNYPESEWVEPAKFQIASCRAALSRGPDYDSGAANEAKQKFEDFLKDHPDAVLSREAEENIDKLKEKEAASSYNIAVFYEKQKAYPAARIYYNAVIEKYPESPWAKKAQDKLPLLEKLEKKK
ncbi:MAG: outer membrane protein assembly factor BamD [Candidatus Omnitrophica bacterium]|nr:outer membrane protein assembly factor BamD [Candidatus Omnitrophota bacterium]